ncbi:hypothetical protein ACH5A3_10065 [Streptomyces echinatus]|uniref:hypothetical protein n=1 Tax=Streptomyces echinatus TaxID=67293 RepID=UPI00379F4F54
MGAAGAGRAAGSRQGRPSQPLGIVAGSRSFLGFEITADRVHGVVTILRGEVTGRLERPLDVPLGTLVRERTGLPGHPGAGARPDRAVNSRFRLTH